MNDVLLGLGIALALFTYFGIGLLISIFIKADLMETAALYFVWPIYVALVLIVLFLYGCFRMGVFVKSRVYRRQRYLERRRKQKENEKAL